MFFYKFYVRKEVYYDWVEFLWINIVWVFDIVWVLSICMFLKKLCIGFDGVFI